jgi:hypothetical protein
MITYYSVYGMVCSFLTIISLPEKNGIIREGNKMAVSFNFNDEVYIRPTKLGREIMTKHFAKLGIAVPGRYEFDRIKMPMWEVMNIFGPAMIQGGDNPIESTIEFA